MHSAYKFPHIAKTTVTIGDNDDLQKMESCGTFIKGSEVKRREGYMAWDITCSNPLKGRYIKVDKKSDNDNFLQLFEFEAYGQYV